MYFIWKTICIFVFKVKLTLFMNIYGNFMPELDQRNINRVRQDMTRGARALTSPRDAKVLKFTPASSLPSAAETLFFSLSLPESFYLHVKTILLTMATTFHDIRQTSDRRLHEATRVTLSPAAISSNTKHSP